ncbi:MAG: hypothetical protein FWG70_06775 [Oscillospiraceae bacterium]|nr:hypothetical protein [Oscillospiraceae bacterium]
MNKGLGFLILGILAIIGGAIFAALVIRNKFGRDEIDFDDFDDYELIIDEEELENFLGEKEAESQEEAEKGAE